MDSNTYVPLDEFIADLKANHFFKDNPHLIDESSIARWVYLALKRFGRGVMTQYEEVIPVRNYRGVLPENFDNLSLAVYCDVDFISHPEDADPIRVQSRIIGERVTQPTVTLCEECTETPDNTRDTERIVENLYLDATLPVKVFYRNFHYVMLGPNLVRKHCAGDCPNMGLKESPYSIDIKGTTMYANFKEGNIYIRYYGAPVDENCLPVIPITPNGYLESFIEYYVMRRILEWARLSKDATNVEGVYRDIRQEEEMLFTRAKVDVSSFDMTKLFRAIGRNRKRMNKYSVNLGAIRSNYDQSGPYNALINPNRY